jgi:2-dehydro-3-deoxyphosphooctonate aldolase (KDO 8-P synthase)
MRVGEISLGDGAPLVLIAGLNVIENEKATLDAAARIKDSAERASLPLIFKASFDKANRSSVDSYRGPGLDEGRRILARVKAEHGLPQLTDVHEIEQAKPVADVVDCLQIPAFLCRQTDLLTACAATGRAIAIKKGQFVAPHDIRHAVEKVRRVPGNGDAFVTERGFAFGYNNLVVDMRGLLQMREFAPVCFDATHSAQFPGAAGQVTGGDRRFVAPLARAAVATGLDALFLEVHPDPTNAPCDGPCQIDFDALDPLLQSVKSIDKILRGSDGRSA